MVLIFPMKPEGEGRLILEETREGCVCTEFVVWVGYSETLCGSLFSFPEPVGDVRTVIMGEGLPPTSTSDPPGAGGILPFDSLASSWGGGPLEFALRVWGALLRKDQCRRWPQFRLLLSVVPPSLLPYFLR